MSTFKFYLIFFIPIYLILFSQTVIALRNVNHVKSAEKLLAVLLNKNQERSIRSAAMSGVAPLLKKDPLVFKKSVLPIFFDRQEDSELRNTGKLQLWNI